MRNSLRNWLGSAFYRLALPCAIASSLATAVVRKFKIQMYLHRRGEAIRWLAERAVEARPRARVCIVIANVVGEEKARDPVLAAPYVERLWRTMDGILTSFADCELTILVSSLPNRSIVHLLPEYQRSRIELIEGPECHPMYVEFRMQDELIQRMDDHDWFLFLEDDIVIHDAYFLRKVQEFNRNAGPRDVLMPHRFEYVEGVKRYIDLNISKTQAWNKASALKINGVKFSEFTNPHAALYFLSREQLKLWDRSGRTWKNRIFVGPLESAATYCLFECFNLYKPHPSNLSYLEVRHYDTKYSQLYPMPESPYTLMAACKSGAGASITRNRSLRRFASPCQVPVRSAVRVGVLTPTSPRWAERPSEQVSNYGLRTRYRSADSRIMQEIRYWHSRHLGRPRLFDLSSPERLGVVYHEPTDMCPADRIMLYALVRGLRPVRAVEIGTRSGNSARIICNAMEENGEGRLVGIDPEPGNLRVRPADLHGRFEAIAGYSPEALPLAAEKLGGKFDFVFVDGMHTYAAVMADMKGALAFLEEGGHLLIHDVYHPGEELAIVDLLEEVPEPVDCGFLTRHPEIRDPVFYQGIRLLRLGPTNGLGLIARAHDAAGRRPPDAEALRNYDIHLVILKGQASLRGEVVDDLGRVSPKAGG